MVMAGVTFFSVVPDSGQVFRLGRWEGSVHTVVDFARQETQTAGARRSSVERTRTQEQFALRNSGAYFFDPWLVTLSIGGDLRSLAGMDSDGWAQCFPLGRVSGVRCLR